jgi:hypothetical protein
MPLGSKLIVIIANGDITKKVQESLLDIQWLENLGIITSSASFNGVIIDGTLTLLPN